MMHIDVQGLDALHARLTAMTTKLDHFNKVEMRQTMSTWQTDDLHRQHPFTKHTHNRVQTTVRPHSRRELLGKRKYLRKVLHQKLPRVRRRSHRIYRRTSTRPILRAELWQSLVERMTAALGEIKW
jgi:hypothetical protein